MLEYINLCTLAVLGYIDYARYKIPNVILCGWFGTLISMDLISGAISKIFIKSLIGMFIVAGSYIPLRLIFKASAGDFKLYAVIAFAVGTENMLKILFISSLISLFPLASGVKQVPMAFTTDFGYIAFLISGFSGNI